MTSDLVNLKSYTPLELILFAGGCYMWVIVYAIYIKHIMKRQMVGMPVFAACSNFAWEFVWGWIPPTTDMGLICVWAYRIWFLLDVYIFYGVLRYGAVQVSTPAIKQYFRPLMIVTALCWGVLYYFFKKEGYDTPIGANSAFIAQMFVSGLYVILILKHHKLVWQSLSIAWLKMIGTGTNVVFMFVHYPNNHFLQTMAALSTTLDCIYLYLFLKKRRENRLAERGT